MTLTDEEKAEARATDPRAAEIIDRCDAMSPEALAQLHGILRDPHALATELMATGSWPPSSWPPMAATGMVDLRDVEPPTFTTGDVPWWDPEATPACSPTSTRVRRRRARSSRGSMVRLQPSRRADAQDLFFAGQLARVSAVHSDVDGNVHVAVVLVDDPAAEMHEWYGRFLYFAPDEVEPLRPDASNSAVRQPRGEPIVKVLGEVTLVGVAAVVVVGLAVGVRSIPDIRRYIKMRKM